MTNSDFKDAHEAGAATKIVSEVIEGITHVLVPPNCSLESMEKLLPAPTRIRNHCTFSDLESFKAYSDQFKEDGSVIYLDEDERKYTTIFDHHKKDEPKNRIDIRS